MLSFSTAKTTLSSPMASCLRAGLPAEVCNVESKLSAPRRLASQLRTDDTAGDFQRTLGLCVKLGFPSDPWTNFGGV